MTILTDILIISLFCNGWYLITHDGMALDPLRKKYLDFAGGLELANGFIEWENYYPILKFLYKPLFGCVICYASIWGSLVYWSIDNSWIHYPIVIISSSCVNLLIKNIYDR
jgi:hypothetical protein